MATFEHHLAALREAIQLIREQRDNYHAALLECERDNRALIEENARLRGQCNELRRDIAGMAA